MSGKAATKGMSDADVYRSTPGYVYGVAAHSSSMKPAEYDCSCPCHKARPESSSSYCDVCHRGSFGTSPKTATHEGAIKAGETDPYPWQQPVPDYYFITKGNTLDDELGEHFKSEKKAEARAKELNDADALKSLRIPKTHRQRFDRYRELHGEHLIWTFYDGERHPLTRFPRKPGKYAVESWGDGDTYWSTYETLDEVREEVLRGDVERIVDLDSGEDVVFTSPPRLERVGFPGFSPGFLGGGELAVFGLQFSDDEAWPPEQNLVREAGGRVDARPGVVPPPTEGARDVGDVVGKRLLGHDEGCRHRSPCSALGSVGDTLT